MSTRLALATLELAIATFIFQPPTGFAQGTAFTYQGRLNTGGMPASGLYDFRFHLAADPLGNNYVGSAFLTNGIEVTNGMLTITMDFGPGIFTGSNFWLEVDLRTNGAVYYEVLTPLQVVTPTPYAVFAATASNLSGTISAAQISGGTIVNAVLPANPNFSGTVLANAFAGSGANLSNLNASAIMSGTVPPARLPASVALLGSNQTFTAQNVFSQAVGFGNPAPVYPVDVLAGQAVVAIEATNSTFGGQLFFQNLETNANEYLGDILFFNYSGSDAGAISYFSAVPTNSNYDSLNFAVGSSAALKFQADPRGSQVGSLIGGNYLINSISTIGCGGDVIAGGGIVSSGNLINSNSSQVFIGAGYGNQVGPNADNSILNGGIANQILAPNSIIGGGSGNVIHINCNFSIISGGGNNQIGYIYPNFVETFLPGHGNLIGGGGGNFIGNGASGCVIGGGLNNIIQTNASCATIPGGSNNLATGIYSFAAGQQAKAVNTGAFVWADSQNAAFTSTANDQFLVRAQGGVGINRTNPATALDVNGTASATIFEGGSLGLGRAPLQPLDVLSGQALARFTTTNNNNGSVIELKNSLAGASTLGAINFNNSSNSYPGQIAYLSTDALSFSVGGTNRMTLNSAGLTVNGTFVSSSDRNVKQDFRPVDSRSVLEKVSQLPVQTWAYKDDPGTKHLGPMAQDFYAAFGTGADDKHIAVVDEGGVALAAIQGLNAKLNEKEARINELENRLNQLEQTLQSLTRRPEKFPER